MDASSDVIADARRPIVFRFSGYMGWDSFKSIFPERWQAAWIGRAMQATTHKGLDYDKTVLIVRMPMQTYEITKDGVAVVTRIALDIPIP